MFTDAPDTSGQQSVQSSVLTQFKLSSLVDEYVEHLIYCCVMRLSRRDC